MPKRIVACTLLLLLGGVAALAQHEPPISEERATEVPREGGFWPTPRMIELVIDKATAEMAERYSFDENQLLQTRELFKQRLPRWMEENKPELMSLTNHWFETMLGAEPPSPEYVATLAKRVQPVFGEFRGLLTETTDKMREFLSDEQQTILDSEMAAFNVATGFVDRRLEGWAAGGYDAATEWPEYQKAREIDDIRRRELETEVEKARLAALEGAGPNANPEGPAVAEQAVAAAIQREMTGAGGAAPAAGGGAEGSGAPRGDGKPKPAPSIAQAPDEWTKYVEEFARRYSLDSDQRSQADRYLKAAKDERNSYLRKKGKEMERLAKRFQEAKDAADRQKADAEYKQLQVPVDNIFTRLKEKLEKLPTRDQRKKAAATAANPPADAPVAGKKP